MPRSCPVHAQTPWAPDHKFGTSMESNKLLWVSVQVFQGICPVHLYPQGRCGQPASTPCTFVMTVTQWCCAFQYQAVLFRTVRASQL